MGFIREQIKEKPISKRQLAAKVAAAALCGLVFAIVVCLILLIALPKITEYWEREEVVQGTEEETDATTQQAERPINTLVLPPDLNLSISDYQTLQDELYCIGNEANRSIVTVTNVGSEDDWMTNDYELEGQGSGLIIAEDNNYVYILTERRIVLDAKHIRVSFVDGTGSVATLLKYDGNTGMAVLTVEKRQLSTSTRKVLKVAVISNAEQVSNGALVIALGSPLGANYSILTGNITSVENKVVTQDKNYSVFTTDIVASENGSGALINTSGEVVGIMMQSFSGSQNASTLTAVAYAEIAEIVDTLKNGKDVPYIGIYLSTVTEDIAQDYVLPMGVFIREVAMDSPAMMAGLQSGDIITQVNGEEVLEDALFSEILRQLIPGTTCEISVKRQNGNEYYDVNCTVTIGVLE